jgi:hypothetical protein
VELKVINISWFVSQKGHVRDNHALYSSAVGDNLPVLLCRLLYCEGLNLYFRAV